MRKERGKNTTYHLEKEVPTFLNIVRGVRTYPGMATQYTKGNQSLIFHINCTEQAYLQIIWVVLMWIVSWMQVQSKEEHVNNTFSLS